MSDKIFRALVVLLLTTLLVLQVVQFVRGDARAVATAQIYAEYVNSAYLSSDTDRIAEQQLLAEEAQIRLLSMLLGHDGNIDSLLVEDLVLEGIAAELMQNLMTPEAIPVAHELHTKTT